MGIFVSACLDDQFPAELGLVPAQLRNVSCLGSHGFETTAGYLGRQTKLRTLGAGGVVDPIWFDEAPSAGPGGFAIDYRPVGV